MGSILGLDIGLNMPSFGGAGSMMSILLWGAIVLLACVIIVISIWFWYQRKIFNIKIRDFENVSGKGYQLTYRDTARLIKVGDGGEEIIFLRRKKQYRTAYGQKQGPNEYWFCKGQDGYMYNFTLGDFDAKMGLLDIEPVDRDMRYMHVAIRKNIQDKYKKINWMEKYGTIVTNSIFLIIMLIGLWFLIDKIVDAIKMLLSGLEANRQSLELIKAALANVDKICSGGSGFSNA